MTDLRGVVSALLVLLAALAPVPDAATGASASGLAGISPAVFDSAPAEQSNWRQLGLAGLSVTSVAAHPHDPSRLYAGVRLSRCRPQRVVDPYTLYASVDGGATWSGTIIGEPGCSTAVTQVGVATTGQIFAIVSEDGTTRSADGGLTWELAPRTWRSTPPQRALSSALGEHRLAISLTDPPVVIVDAGLDPGDRKYPGYALAQSRDGGATWERIGPPLREPSPPVAMLPASPQTIIVGASHDGGIWRTDDGGQTWLHLGERAVPGVLTFLLMAPTDGSVLYALNGTSVPAEWGLWRSVDGGSSWAQTQSTTRYQLLAIDPRYPQGNAIVVASTDGIHFSGDGGVTLDDLGRPPGQRWTPRALLVQGDNLLVGTDDGVWQTSMPPIRPHSSDP